MEGTLYKRGSREVPMKASHGRGVGQAYSPTAVMNAIERVVKCRNKTTQPSLDMESRKAGALIGPENRDEVKSRVESFPTLSAIYASIVQWENTRLSAEIPEIETPWKRQVREA